MTRIRPLLFSWDGEAMRPYGSIMAGRADDQFVVGEKYTLVQHEDRSQQSQGHYFSVLKEMWESLPEHLRGETWSESPEHLRKFALIRCGFYDAQEFPCGTAAEAERWAARLKPMDEFSIVDVRGSMVRRFTAKSQSRAAMPQKGEFQRSKNQVIEYIASLIGTKPEDAGWTT